MFCPSKQLRNITKQEATDLIDEVPFFGIFEISVTCETIPGRVPGCAVCSGKLGFSLLEIGCKS